MAGELREAVGDEDLAIWAPRLFAQRAYLTRRAPGGQVFVRYWSDRDKVFKDLGTIPLGSWTTSMAQLTNDVPANDRRAQPASETEGIDWVEVS